MGNDPTLVRTTGWEENDPYTTKPKSKWNSGRVGLKKIRSMDRRQQCITSINTISRANISYLIFTDLESSTSTKFCSDTNLSSKTLSISSSSTLAGHCAHHHISNSRVNIKVHSFAINTITMWSKFTFIG